jgi:hypothetical protein
VLYRNEHDPVGPPDLAWARPFQEAIRIESRSGPGGHPFADYAANGSVQGAFAFVLAHLP